MIVPSTPKRIELNSKEQSALIERVNISNLAPEDRDLIVGLIEFNHWLQVAIADKNITIHKLKHAFFSTSDTPSIKLVNDTGQDSIKPKKNKQSKNHGRISKEQYADIETVEIKHDKLKAGQVCPEDCGGRLWPVQAGNIIKITGQGFAKATKYVQQKLRCGLCGLLLSAPLPPSISDSKYDYQFKSQLCMLKYYMGLPFYRIEAYQKTLGMPLPDSTQWQLVEEVANSVYPIFYHLENLAAQGRLVHADDTTVRILSCILENKNPETNLKRKGMFTTGILSYVAENKIYLYYSGRQHAGENIKNVLANRNKTLPPIQYICDALSRNVPDELKVILINCLSHARRKFVEIEPYFDQECQYVIKQLATVYHNDAISKRKPMNPDERLAYHKEHSQPIMNTLHEWLNNQLDNRLTEPNSALGKAIQYFLNHWNALTQFLKISGAPLDNNILEAGLKIPIRIRKNAMFYKTKHGAFIGSMLLSIIQTCIAANENPVEYLTALQEKKSQIFKEPENFLPWNYKSQVGKFESVAA